MPRKAAGSGKVQSVNLLNRLQPVQDWGERADAHCEGVRIRFHQSGEKNVMKLKQLQQRHQYALRFEG